MWRRVGYYLVSNVSEEPDASIFTDGGSGILGSADTELSVYKRSYLMRLQKS